MIIDTYLTPTDLETEDQFSDSIVIMIDVLRASTTVAAALNNGAKELLVFESLDQAVKLYNNLSKGGAFLGGERGGLKPSGFDAGNSPFDYSREAVENKTVILTTTNGTKIFQKAKKAKFRIIAGFVNLSAVLDFVSKQINNQQEIQSIFVLAAGNKGKLSYEDTLCAGAFVNSLSKLATHLTDSSRMANDLYMKHADCIFDFLKDSEHSRKLTELGFATDIEIAFTLDAFPVVPLINGNNVKLAII